MHHHKFDEVKILVDVGQPVMLVGEKGSGKTTLAMQIAEDLKLQFFSMSMTRQTTLSHLLGFMSVNGTYVSSQLRKAVEEGGVMLLDEMDAADANVLLALNTIENGYVSFPDGVKHLHKDFRLISTGNPMDQHSHYTGRVKLDGATLDRFDIIDIDRDNDLEQSLVDADTYRRMTVLREVLKEQNSSLIVSMRDSMRYQKRKDLGLLKGFVNRIVSHNELALDAYEIKVAELPKHNDQSDCTTFGDLVELMQVQAGLPRDENPE